MDQHISALMEQYRKWRETELAADQDVDDAEAYAIQADLKHQEAKRKAKLVKVKVNEVQQELADAIDEHTAPLEIVFLADGDDAVGDN